MKYSPNTPDPDDYFADSRMTFGEHIEDLRTHLFKAIYGFLIGMVLSLFIAKPVLQFIAAPVERQLKNYWERHNANKQGEVIQALKDGMYDGKKIFIPAVRIDLEELSERLAGRLKVEYQKPEKGADFLQEFEHVFEALDLSDFLPKRDNPRYMDLKPSPEDFAKSFMRFNLMIRPPTLSTLSVQEAFVVFFKVAILAGFVLSSPWVFYQIWMFIAAGLYPHEKRLVNVFLPVSLMLFFLGVFICEFFVIPKAIEALLWFNEWLDLQPDPRLNEWLSFAIFMPLVFGLSFQTPLVMMFLERVGIFDIQVYRQKRKMAWFVMAIFSAVITPSTDAFSMLFLLIPMCLLYELGIGLCLMRPRSEWELDADRPEENVEV